jgi:hypothetical protein
MSVRQALRDYEAFCERLFSIKRFPLFRTSSWPSKRKKLEKQTSLKEGSSVIREHENEDFRFDEKRCKT